MSGFLGADTDQIRALSTTLAARARRLNELAKSLDAVVLREDAWTGVDADAFRLDYRTSIRPTTAHAAGLLTVFSTQLTEQADEQDAASSADTSGSGALGLLEQRGDNRSSRAGTGLSNSPRRDGDDSHDPDAENPNAQYSTPGPAATPPGQSGLGAGIPGTHAHPPAPPAWTPPADGAGEYNSEFGGPMDHLTHSLAREGADLKRSDWPNAAKHLDHFLDNTGEDYPADVDALLKDQPQFAKKVADAREQAGSDAIAKAQKDGASGPITYPLSTPWAGHTADGDWFYASGSYNYNQTGTVTVYPPDNDHYAWRYTADTQVNFRDRYNWDGNKATDIGPFTVKDESLAALHRGGLAREFNLIGASSTQHSEGSNK